MKFIALCLTVFALSASSLLADDSSFIGTWNTNWGLLIIKQGEEKLTGKYSGKFSGTIEGTVKEGKLHYKWVQPNGEWGSGVFTVSEDGNTLTGTWGGANSETNGGAWNGKRES